MPADPAPWRDCTLSLDEVQRLALRWVVVTALATLVPHALVWGVSLPATWAGLWQDLGGWLWHVFVLGLVYLASIPVHEGLHAFAMRAAAGVPWRSITFGAKLRAGAVYVHTDAPMTVRAYRIVLLTPVVVQGLLPAVVGLATGWLYDRRLQQLDRPRLGVDLRLYAEG